MALAMALILGLLNFRKRENLLSFIREALASPYLCYSTHSLKQNELITTMLETMIVANTKTDSAMIPLVVSLYHGAMYLI